MSKRKCSDMEHNYAKKKLEVCKYLKKIEQPKKARKSLRRSDSKDSTESSMTADKIKMQCTETSESNNEPTTNQEVEVEKNDSTSFNNSNETDLSTDLSFTILSKCDAENPNVSMINTLNLSSSESEFSEKRISSILRENTKLKELFKHKSNSNRKQLSVIIALYKEIQQICENYNQYFLEATDIIRQLKEENCMLKARPVLSLSMEDENEAANNAPTTRELNLIGQLRDLTRQLKDSQDNYSTSQLKLKEIQDKYTVDVDNFNEVLRKCEEELKMLKEKIVSSSHSDLLHCKNELEKEYLLQLTASLKQSLEEKKLIETANEESNHREKLHELFKCFTKHCMNALGVENFPDECDKILKVFKNVEIPYNQNIADALPSQKDKFNYKNALIDDQLQSIKDERNFRNAQVEFLKVYSDYNNVSSNMECLKSEAFKKNDKKVTAPESDNHNNLAEIEKCLIEEKKIIDIARVKINEERSSIEEEKEQIREEREIFDAERISLLEEKESIMQENKDIVNENLFLNREMTKLKKELASRRDSTASLEEQLETITAQLNEAKGKLKNSLEANSGLREEMNKMMDKEEEIWAYKIQVEEQQNEFLQMHQAEQNFLQQIEQLSEEIRELRAENTQLRQRDAQQQLL